MKLSIITITYNNLEGLKSTFKSIISQSWQDFEWIVIDGGSNDGTKDFLEKNSTRFSFWCCEPDKGIYDAQNKGVHHASGDYLCFMNAGDSFINKDILYQVEKYLGDADILYGDTVFDDGKKQVIVCHPQQVTLSWLCRYAINHQSTFIKREICEQFKFDTKYKMLADRKLWIQCKIADKRFVYLSLVTTLYDANGLSSLNKDKWEKEQQDICNELLPQCFQQSLCSAHYYESSLDMQRVHLILEKEGPLRKILHIFIKWICACKNIDIKKNQYAGLKK